ncbi:hypothetical protein [Aestuariispira insulae]|uniref:Uncharacterized protein n=1 Tax=Aestuariispira insulae TaxID=1461337 RepID=A0A3D9HXD3_9PROT|nr:hypothetical protein [Aestuariispira insulae]RED54157.1 hypothetical protein DFP90_101960 [Aestuariispira insulae]
MARTPQEIQTEFQRLKTVLNSLPPEKKGMAGELKKNMRGLQEEMKALEAGGQPGKKKKKRGSSAVLANMIVLVLLLVIGVFALSYFGGKLASM